jgi:glycosyltransferase involved in cell wall biosynthesis
VAKKLLQINPVMRINTSTGRIMQEIGDIAMRNGWESYIAYSKGRDGVEKPCNSQKVPVGNKLDTIIHGLATRFFDRHGLVSKGATKDFIKQIEEIKPDIIHIHNIHGYFLNYQVLFDYLAKADIPVVWTIHDCWLYTGHCYYYSFAKCDKWMTGCGKCPQQRLFPASWFVDRSAQNYIDKKNAFTSISQGRLVIVPVSEWIRGEMSRSFLKDCEYRVIHNGIDLNTFTIRDTKAVKDKYGLNGKRIYLGLASIWSTEKGWDDFMEMSKLLNDDETIVLVGVEKAKIQDLPKNVIGITRTENIGQLAELYSAADVFVNPTWQDNYPTVNLEAISCGTPVVTYRTGGSVEAITEQTGVVVEQGDVNGLLNTARDVASRGKEYYQEPCREYALQNFKKENRYVDYLKLYDELVGRKSGKI